MADVQIDNGEFTRVANVLMEQVAKQHLNGTQCSIILTVWRFTYGFQRCEHKLSVTFIATATGVSTRAIKKELKILIDRNIIIVMKESTKAESRVLKFNKDYESWIEGNKKTPHIQGNNSSPGEQLIPSQGNYCSPKQGNKKTPKKEILKETLKETSAVILKPDEVDFISVLESIKSYPLDREKDLLMYRNLQAVFPTINTLDAIRDWAVYKMDKPLKVKESPRSQINNSFRNCVKWGKNLKQKEEPKRQIRM